jgi:transcriptional regulator with XRE-family HTH domain
MSTTPLRAIRTARHLSLATVATAIGLDTGNLSRIERMTQQASPSTAEALSNYFDREITEEQILYPERFVEKATA